MVIDVSSYLYIFSCNMLLLRFFLTVVIISFMQVSKTYFPELAVGFEDPRVRLHIGDGMHEQYTCPISTVLILIYGFL